MTWREWLDKTERMVHSTVIGLSAHELNTLLLQAYAAGELHTLLTHRVAAPR